MNSHLVYPFQGEHHKDIREEALELIKVHFSSMEGLYLCSLFNESHIVNDTINQKKASKFYNLQKGTNPKLAKKVNKKVENMKKSKELKKGEKSIADILNSDKKQKKNSENNSQAIKESFSFKNRKIVYNMLKTLLLETSNSESKIIGENNMPVQFSGNKIPFNDLKYLMDYNKSINKKTIFLSSDGGLFKVIEGAFYGCQVFEGGFPFEVSKKREAITVDFKKWALLLVQLLLNKSILGESKIEVHVLLVISLNNDTLMYEKILISSSIYKVYKIIFVISIYF